MKKKVAIIFPRYSLDDASHYPYWYKLFQSASKHLEISIVYEKNTKNYNHQQYAKLHKSTKNVLFQKVYIKPFNLVERLLLLILLRLRGYKIFYIHYSAWSLFLAKIITTLSGGKTYFWDCEYYQDTISNRLQKLAIITTDVLVTGHKKIGDQYKNVLNIPKKDVRIVSNWIYNSSKNSNNTRLNTQNELKSTKLPVVLFIHHLSSRKGSKELPIIIKKSLALSKKKFLIVGGGPDLPYINNWVINNSLKKYVKTFGNLPHTKALALFERSDTFIIPSRSEGFPRVILEALISGVPYSATNVGCIKEITPPALLPFIVEPKKPADFSRSLEQLITMPIRKKIIMQKQMITHAARYSLAKTVSQFVNLF